MTINTVMRVTDPDAIPLTLSITMSLAEWERLRAQLTPSYPSLQLAIIISQAVSKAVFHYEVTAQGEMKP